MATGEPDNAVLIWKWTTGKVLVAANSNFKLNFVSLNPWDGTQLLCIGDDELNYMEFVEEELKLKADTPLYHVSTCGNCVAAKVCKCMLWLPFWEGSNSQNRVSIISVIRFTCSR